MSHLTEPTAGGSEFEDRPDELVIYEDDTYGLGVFIVDKLGARVDLASGEVNGQRTRQDAFSLFIPAGVLAIRGEDIKDGSMVTVCFGDGTTLRLDEQQEGELKDMTPEDFSELREEEVVIGEVNSYLGLKVSEVMAACLSGVNSGKTIEGKSPVGIFYDMLEAEDGAHSQ